MWSGHAPSCQVEDAGTSRSEKKSESPLDVIFPSIPYLQVDSPEAAANHVLHLSVCLSAHSSSAPSNLKVNFSDISITSQMTHHVLLGARNQSGVTNFCLNIIIQLGSY